MATANRYRLEKLFMGAAVQWLSLEMLLPTWNK